MIIATTDIFKLYLKTFLISVIETLKRPEHCAKFCWFKAAPAEITGGWNVAFHFNAFILSPILCYLRQSSRLSECVLWILFCREVALSARLLPCFLTLGTALRAFINIRDAQHIITRCLLTHTRMRPRVHTDAHAFTCANVHSTRSRGAVRLRGTLGLPLQFCAFTLCSHVHYFLYPPFHLVTAYLSPCRSAPIASHLFLRLPSFPLSLPFSSRLSSHTLPYRLLLSVNFNVRTDSVFCR